MWWYRPDWRKPTDCWIWGSALHPLTTTWDTHSVVLWTFPPSFAMNFFKTKPRTPPDLVRGLRDAINRLESGAPGGETRRKVRMISLALWARLLSFWVERFLLGNGRRFQKPPANQSNLVRGWRWAILALTRLTADWSLSIRTSTRAHCPARTGDLQHRPPSAPRPEYLQVRVRSEEGCRPDIQQPPASADRFTMAHSWIS